MNAQIPRRFNRGLGWLAGAALLSALAFWVGDYTPATHASGAGAPLAATSPAAPATGTAGNGFAQIATAITPAVVNITATAPRPTRGRESRDPLDEWFGMPGRPHGPSPGEPRGGVGSGVIVSQDGYIVTNNHVVEGARELTVTLPDKREFHGKVVGTDPKSDLAVIKVEGRNLPFAPWGDSSKLQVGDYVLAVGNPFGLNSTVTLGIVSALGRGRMGITQYEDFIQTDAAINPGNSGGALINQAGELVGINTAIISQTGGYQGVGFAVPVSMAKPVYERLMATGKVVRGYLGVGIQDLNQELAKSFDLTEAKGALVSNVGEDSAADQAGRKQGVVMVGDPGRAVEEAGARQRLG
ncbi:MAG: trypsin-like peptidase domain-containing protein, partial [Nitrospiraceae bacterium]